MDLRALKEFLISVSCLRLWRVGDELTNLYKMKRNVISDKYAKLIKSMYE